MSETAQLTDLQDQSTGNDSEQSQYRTDGWNLNGNHLQ